MKRMISLVLLFCLCACLCACAESDEGKYQDLIAAIESDDYSRALEELQELMDVPQTQPTAGATQAPTGGSRPEPVPSENETKPEETRPEACRHSGTDATCTEDSLCIHCGVVLSEALGHDYHNGACIRCGEVDPAEAEKLDDYNDLVSKISYYEQWGSVYGNDGYLQGSAAAEYLYHRLAGLGDYRDCPEYLSRFCVVKDQLLYIELRETDNLGNLINSTTIDYEFDSRGRVTMSEHIDFNEQLGAYLLDSFSFSMADHYAHGGSQYYTAVQYGQDGLISKIECYYVSLRAVLMPVYSAEGRIQSMQYQLNTEGGSLEFDYDGEGRLLSIQGPNYQLSYQYNADGTLQSKQTSGGYGADTTVYAYDDSGLLTGWTRSDAACAAEHDGRGRVIRQTVTTEEGQTVYDYHYGDYYIYQPTQTP